MSDYEEDRRRECVQMWIAVVVIAVIIAIFTLLALKRDVERSFHSQTNQSMEED